MVYDRTLWCNFVYVADPI